MTALAPGNAEPSSIEWRWHDDPTRGTAIARPETGQRFVFRAACASPHDTPDCRRFEIAALHGDRVDWVYALPLGTADSAWLVTHDERLYAAVYLAGASGCRVIALEIANGQPSWEAALQGLGPLHHSKYRNRVQLAWIDAALVVFGDESAGRYIEVLDPKDGRTVTLRKPGSP